MSIAEWKAQNMINYLKEQNNIDPVIEANGFFSHAENMLVAMIMCEHQRIRKLSLQRIMLARKDTDTEICTFVIPSFNTEVKDNINIINWQLYSLTEPPLKEQIPDQELEGLIRGNK